MKLENKSVIVTGAGRGLGRAIALAMVREGARVTILSRTVKELKEVAGQIKKQGGSCHVVEADVSDPTAVRRAVGQAMERFKTIDVLINNAAVIGPARILRDTDVDSWDQTINVNLNGAFYFVREVAPVMVRKGHGKIISISSGLGQMPFPCFCAYSVSKAGIIQLTRSLSAEFKDRNIQVNAIDPGVMDTALQVQIRALGPSVLGETVYQNFLEYRRQGHLKGPEEIAPLAVFLASDESNHLSGHYGGLGDYAGLGFCGKSAQKKP